MQHALPVLISFYCWLSELESNRRKQQEKTICIPACLEFSANLMYNNSHMPHTVSLPGEQINWHYYKEC